MIPTETKVINKKIGVFSIWAIGVGMVISGESFGWNLGWAITGPNWFYLPVFVAAIMYFGLVQSLIELACVYPNVKGPHEYVEFAFGKNAGAFIVLAVLFEFLFATPAIASSLGEYLGFLIGDLSLAPWIATLFLVAFSVINLFEVHIGVRFLTILTLMAIAELFLYQGAVISSFKLENFASNAFGNMSFESFIQSIPYAIWLFLAIEGISLMTPDIQKNNFRKKIGLGYNLAFFTLFILAVLVLTLAAGGIDWSNPASLSILEENHPMPASMALILGKGHILVQIFTFIGLFGLLASLQGIALAATTQLEPLMPQFSARFASKRVLASGLVLFISLLAVWSSGTGFLIELSVFGAVCMYFAVSISLIKLRRKADTSIRQTLAEGTYAHVSFNSYFSSANAWLAAFISLICVLAFVYLQFTSFLIFVACSLVYVFVIQKK